MSAWAYDAVHDTIDIVTSDGMFHEYSLGNQTFTRTIAIGGSPGSIDVSPDGLYVAVGNSKSIITSGPFDFRPTYADVVTRITLSTGAVDRLQFAVDGFEAGVSHVAISVTDTVYFTTAVNGSGWTPLRQFQADAAVPVIQTTQGLSMISASGVGSYLLPSEDRRHILVQELFSDGAMHVLHSATPGVISSNDLYNLGSSGYNSGHGDINSAAGMVVDVLYNNVFVFDLNLRPLANLSTYTSIGSVVGAEFNDGGHQLFLWQAAQVLVIDTLTWQNVGRFAVSAAPGAGYVGAPYGTMDVVSGGRVLVLDRGGSLELIDLATSLKINIAGDATSQKLFGAIGADTISGGGGDDTITGFDGQSYLRGDDGNDSLIGGSGFDDANGNVGNDTVSTGAGEDYCVGGKDNDSLAGGADHDLVYGNLGADTCDGGEGNDIVRGGQDNDVVLGGNGDDFVSGDKGDDTMTGGAGADIFHTFGDAGLDRVTDFSLAQGDRVQLDPGTQFTVSQVGADTVINMTGGGQMVLVGVTLSTLTAGWIFGA